MPQRDIADWGRTVADTLGQLGKKNTPARTPRPKYSSLSQSSRTRHKNRIASKRRRG